MRKPKPFRRSDRGKYYFRFTAENGNRTQKCLDTYDYDEAYIRMMAILNKIEVPSIPTFLVELRKYQSIDTNPRYKEAQITGDRYSLRYAKTVACRTKKLEKIFMKQCPELLGLKLDEFKRRDVKTLTEAIVNELGHIRTAQMLQQNLKGVFNTAWQDGVIESSPAFNMKRISYTSTRRMAIPNEWLAWVINNPNLFLDHEAWAYFTIAATTGMRRSEILALSKEQIKGDVLIINRAMSDIQMDAPIGLPKCGIVRTIPLSKITLDAINSLSPNIKNGRYLYHPCSWVDSLMRNLKATLNGVDSEHKDLWKEMSSHVLRHSFNTNLIVAGADPNLVAEYCGWEHQGPLLDMQKRYTHFVSRHLRQVSEKTDEIYSFREDLLAVL